MTWHGRSSESLVDAFNAVETALTALKYLRPDIGPLTSEFIDLASALTETGKVPPGMDPLRFAAQVVFYVRNAGQAL